MDNIENIFKDMNKIGVKQVILQGPPGTSKTHGAKEIIVSVLNDKNKDNTKDITIESLRKYKLTEKHYTDNELKEDVYWDIVQFHPSYSYEDFVRGISVSTIPNDKNVVNDNTNSSSIKYDTVNKIFGKICKLAGKNDNKTFFLIIDEINRADVATVFGELIYALEYRGVSNKIATPYSVKGECDIYVPNNLYIIGTMNTADKSVGTIDMAIRRRFLFVDMLPDEKVIEESFRNLDNNALDIKWKDLAEKTVRCFNRLKEIVSNSIRGNYKKKDFMIGHTYFLPNKEDAKATEDCIRLKLKYQVLPILREYTEDRIIEVGNIGPDYKNLIDYLRGEDNVLEDAIDEMF